MHNNTIITMKEISKNYNLGKTLIPAIKNVSLDILEGDFLVFAGASGSGKTTLLNLIGLIDKPSEGDIRFGDEILSNFSLNSLYGYRRDKIGYIFQNFNLISVLNVYENVEYPLLLNKTPAKERKKLVESILETVGLYDRRKHKPNELSGGQRQRVSIARAVVKNPKIILADEPTANLDSKTGVGIVELMENLNKNNNITFIFSSHDPMIIDKAHRVIKLIDGKIENSKIN